MRISQAGKIFACSRCKFDLFIGDQDQRIACPSCLAEFVKDTLVWNFIPQENEISLPIWRAWQAVQDNGVASYQADPDHNLSVGKREDCKRFADFCNYHGMVLDVGCGPQPWPAYFDADEKVFFIGVDPLAGTQPSGYLTMKALAEYLPFRDRVFDHVLFSTTLDHFVDPVESLREAVRVCKPSGEIDVWLGEKKPGAPTPVSSPEWYTRLKKPELAEDVFHIKRLNSDEFRAIAKKVGVHIVQAEAHPIDAYRTSYFYRLKTSAD
ncbi:MAG: class I SAM-dependent methyltransferase [Nitrospira sp.]